jgi:hypothetical protein
MSGGFVVVIDQNLSADCCQDSVPRVRDVFGCRDFLGHILYIGYWGGVLDSALLN